MERGIDKVRDDYNWIPKYKYEQILEKMNILAMENNALKIENEKLKKTGHSDYAIKGLGIGSLN